MNVAVVEGITGLFKGLFGLVDDLHTSQEEKMAAQQRLLEIQGGLLSRWLEHEQRLLEAKTNVIIAEARGESWLQRSWRPIAMLFMLGLVGAHWFGFTPENLAPSHIDNMFLLVQIGIGGYVAGRSAEKVAKHMTGRTITDMIKGEKK